jgi:hypothetical protein
MNLPLPQAKVSAIGDKGIDGLYQAGVKESGKNHDHDHKIGIPSIKNAIKRRAKSEDDIYSEDMEKLVPIMNELDNVLSMYPQGKRDFIRNMVIMLCVSSVDPISNLKEYVSFIKNNKLTYEIRDCISSFCNISTPMASVVLRNSILVKHKRDVRADTANSGFVLQQMQQPHKQQQQQKPRSPPYYVLSIKKLKPHNQKDPNIEERND